METFTVGLRLHLIWLFLFAATPLALGAPSEKAPRATPMLEALYQFRSNPPSALAQENFIQQFEALETLFKLKSYVLEVPTGRDSKAVAQAALCALDPAACERTEVKTQLKALAPVAPVKVEDPNGFGDPLTHRAFIYQALHYESDGQGQLLLLLPEADGFRNERSELALYAFAREALQRQLGPTAPIPTWWLQGQERYLTARLVSFFRVGSFALQGYLSTITYYLGVRLEEQESLDVRQGKWLDISFAAIHRLVSQHGARAIFIDINNQYAQGASWEDAFTSRLGESSTAFAQRLEQEIRANTDQTQHPAVTDIVEGLFAPWETGTLSASGLLYVPEVTLLGTVPLQGTPGCPASLLMESYELGDFNGDGFQDLAFTMDESTFGSLSDDTACFSPTTVIIVYGAPANTKPQLAVVDNDARGARDTAVADLNQDGFDDLLVVGSRNAEDYNPNTMPRLSDSRLYLGSAAGLRPATDALKNETTFSPYGTGSEFATAGDFDGDGAEEFLFFGANLSVKQAVPLVIDCDEVCTLRHPAGFDLEAYPNREGVSVYNGALLDLNRDGELDLLLNVQVDPERFDGPPYSEAYLHAAFFQRGGNYLLTADPVEQALGFRLDNNTEPLRTADGRDLPLDAAHYWEADVLDIDGDSVNELITLENNQFHVENARFLIATYAFDESLGRFSLSAAQPPATKAIHDQNLIFQDFDGDGDLEILSTYTGDAGPYHFSLHEKTATGWRLSQAGYHNFMLENGCNRLFLPDSDGDQDRDVIFFCNGGASERLVYFGRNLKREQFSAPDSDQDRLSDAEEAALGTDPLAMDSDGDGLDDALETRLGLNPLLQDTDGDSVPDGDEMKRGRDPATEDCPVDRCLPSVPLWLQYHIRQKKQEG